METAIRLARQACRSEKTQGLGRKRRNKYREEALSRVAGQTERLGISRPDRSAISPPCGTVTCSGSTIDPREANGIGSPGCKGIAEMRLMPGCLVLAVLGLCPASLRAAGGEQTPGLLEPLKPITSISTSIQPQRGRLPTDHAGQVDLQRAASSAAARPPRGWTGFCWTARGSATGPCTLKTRPSNDTDTPWVSVSRWLRPSILWEIWPSCRIAWRQNLPLSASTFSGTSGPAPQLPCVTTGHPCESAAGWPRRESRPGSCSSCRRTFAYAVPPGGRSPRRLEAASPFRPRLSCRPSPSRQPAWSSARDPTPRPVRLPAESAARGRSAGSSFPF